MAARVATPSFEDKKVQIGTISWVRVLAIAAFLIGSKVMAPAQTDAEKGEQIVRQKCDTCHTLKDDKQQPVVGYLAGGKLIGGAASANLTPDASGISYYDEKMFLQVLRTGQVGARKLKPVMNPALFKGISDEELKAVFAYLRTVPAIKHRVDNTEEPTDCKLCRQKHGGGASN
jgi:mono/diheme cytochrome c family protein